MRNIVFCLTLVLAANRLSAFPFFDPFTDSTASGGTSYAVGSPLETQADGLGDVWNSLGGNFPGAKPLLVAGNLSYPGLPPSTGNSVSFVPAANMSVRLNFGLTITRSSTRAYYSFKLKLTDLTAVPTTAANNYFVCLSDGSGGQVQQLARAGARLLTKRSGTGFVLGVGRNNVTTDYVYDSNVYQTNDTVFVVASYDTIGGTTNVNLWVNPPASSFGSNNVPTATVALGNVSSFASDINNNVAGFCIMCQNPTAPSGIIDDVRIGTNWVAVTGGDPAILTAPTNRIAPPGNNVSFSVTARGTPTLSYLWYKDTAPLSDGGNISGSTTPTLNVNNISVAEVGNYSVFVTNGIGDFVQSPSASLALLTDPIITNQPQSFTTNAGGTATFQVGVGGTAPFGYQWHKQGSGDLSDGPNISGAQSGTLTLSSLAFPDGGSYYVTVSNSFGTVDSADAVLTVRDPYVTTQPVSVTTNAGATVTFHVVVAGTGPFTYQWLTNGGLLFDGGHVTGVSTDTLTVANVSPADQWAYSAAVIGTYSTTTSSVANLTVLSPVSISVQPRSRNVATGTRAVFSVVASGFGTLSYQWQREGADVPGATSTAYILNNVQPAMAGNYRVVITNSFSSLTSSVVALGVSNTLSLAESNLVVIRVGDGAQTLGLNGNSIYLDQFAPDGTYVNTITLPEDGPSAVTALGWDNVTGVNSGTTTGSGLSRSLDGRFMVVAAYATNLNYGAGLQNSFATNVPRGIALIDSYGQYNLAVASTNSVFDTTFWRSAVTDGTNNFWGAGGAGGTFYFGFDAPEAVVQTDFINQRSMALFNGDIYGVGAVNGKNGVLKLSGMPTAAATPTVLFAGSTGDYDCIVNPTGTLIYLVDQRSLANGGGIQRYDFDGSNWNLTYTMTAGVGTVGPRYVTADFSGADPVIYITSNDLSFDNNRIIRVVDTGASSSGTTLAYAGASETFRGIRFGPVPNYVAPRPVLGFLRDGGNLILNWSGAAVLQSATNVVGNYQDVLGATSPYTNNVAAPAQKYFRLRQ